MFLTVVEYMVISFCEAETAATGFVRRAVTKTLKKLLSEAGIPPERRDSLALLSDDRGLLWAEGFGCDERAAAVCPLQGDQYWMVCIEGKDYE